MGMLSWAGEKTKLRMEYEKRHKALDAHRDLIGGIRLFKTTVTGNTVNIAFHCDTISFTYIDLDIFLLENDTPSRVGVLLKQLHKCCPAIREQKHKLVIGKPSQSSLAWKYTWETHVKGTSQRKTYIICYFWLATGGLCKRVKVGEEMKDIYEIQCGGVRV